MADLSSGGSGRHRNRREELGARWPAVVVGFLILGSALVVESRPRSRAPDAGFDASFPAKLSPDMPGDVDPALRKRLLEQGELAKLRRVFNIYSWQAFIAINWPVDRDGRPRPRISDAGSPRWFSWKESPEVFKDDGSKPSRWGSPRELPAMSPPLPLSNAPERGLRILHLSNKLVNFADEEDQAFQGPLWDQNGNIVRYEILLNREEFDYIVDNGLYNLDGQIAFSATHSLADFPSGVHGTNKVGAVEIKLAWKILDEAKGDVPGRFFHTTAYVLDDSQNNWVRKQVGLIGLHISQKTTSAPQWVWSTFEHVDNLRVDELAEVIVDGRRRKLRPSLNDPACETCPVNVPPSPDGAGVKRTQVQRLIPIPKAVEALNRQVQEIARAQGSVWQYYELIDTQYPTEPSQPPTPPGPGTAPGSVANKPGGKPNLAYLTNMTMETYFQLGNQPASRLEEGFAPDTTPVFGTESCIGCHSSAGIARSFTVDSNGKKAPVFGGQLTGDFSWLLQQKARWKK